MIKLSPIIIMGKVFFVLFNLLMISPIFAQDKISLQSIKLDGKSLTIDEIVRVAKQQAIVEIDTQALINVQRSHQLLLLAAEKNMPIYGLNRGVGLNKDKTIFKGNVLTPAARKQSEQFNLNDIYATSAAVGPDAPADDVRAAMVIRLNTFLLGHSGVQPAVVNMLQAFLNNDVVPIFPSGGSIGEADIPILAHLALAMTGRGEVLYKGKLMSASAALQTIGLKPLHLYGKDALSIFSSNAYTAGLASLAIAEVENLMNKYDLLVALSLEAINGNIAPFLNSVYAIRHFPQQEATVKNILSYLRGSYLFGPSLKRPLQDPLSFRTVGQVSGAARDAVEELKKDLLIQLNSSDDNPAVVLDIVPNSNTSLQEKSYYVSNNKLSGAILPTANFEPIAWVLDIEKLNIALGHLSASSTQRIVRLSSICINQLSRFLAPNQTTIAFAAAQKAIMYLNTNIQQQVLPVSTLSYPVAGEIEDTATNSLLVVQHLNTIIDNLYQIMGFELIHASQAIDLRKLQSPGLTFGKSTTILFTNFRKVVPFLQQDRELTPDIKKAYHFIRGIH